MAEPGLTPGCDLVCDVETLDFFIARGRVSWDNLGFTANRGYLFSKALVWEVEQRKIEPDAGLFLCGRKALSVPDPARW